MNRDTKNIKPDAIAALQSSLVAPARGPDDSTHFSARGCDVCGETGLMVTDYKGRKTPRGKLIYFTICDNCQIIWIG